MANSLASLIEQLPKSTQQKIRNHSQMLIDSENTLRESRKKQMRSQDALNTELLDVVAKLNEAGDSWGSWSEEIVRIAIRRWNSFERRNRKSRHGDSRDRVADLAEGLKQHFEPDVHYIHPSDWLALAKALAQTLKSF